RLAHILLTLVPQGMLVYWLRSRHKIKTIEMSDGWWGSGERPVKGKEDESIRPFRIETSDKEIEVPVGCERGRKLQG
uniref:Uncharacterized protein n=1 Tax=Amazona collaria TaxID=241587 RepID=A0A8B9IV01_9PSIT